MRLLFALLTTLIAAFGIFSGISVYSASFAEFLASSMPWLPWAEVRALVAGQEVIAGAIILAVGGFLIGFILNFVVSRILPVKDAKRPDVMSMFSGFFWGLIVIAIGLGFIALGLFTYQDVDIDATGYHEGRIRVPMIFAIFVAAYFFLYKAIGAVALGIVAMVVGAVIILGGLLLVADGDSDDDEEE